jgi:tellurite resistance protein
MNITDDEALACLKVLIAMGKADGRLQGDERKALEAAVHRFDVPLGTSLDALLREAIDVDAELAVITSSAAKEQLYRSAHFLANADGVSAPEERVLLARIESATSPSAALRAQLASLAPPPGGSAWIESLRGLFRGG